MIIYAITNKLNNKKYIGQTINFNSRMQQHKKAYCTKYKDKTYVQLVDEDIIKYGEENFIFEIIDTAKNQDELNEKEKYYISKYKTHISHGGYNVKWGGIGGGKHAEETKKKIGDSQKGELNHMYGVKGSDNHSSKRVKDIFNNIIYVSATDASEKLGIQQSKICACARGDRISVGGYVFRYVDENENIIPCTGNADYKIKCVETNEIFELTAIAEYELFGKINGSIAKSIPRGNKCKGYKFEKVC